MQAESKATTTARVINFPTAKRTTRRRQRGKSVTQVATRSGKTLSPAQRLRLDQVRAAAKARI